MYHHTILKWTAKCYWLTESVNIQVYVKLNIFLPSSILFQKISNFPPTGFYLNSHLSGNSSLACWLSLKILAFWVHSPRCLRNSKTLLWVGLVFAGTQWSNIQIVLTCHKSYFQSRVILWWIFVLKIEH